MFTGIVETTSAIIENVNGLLRMNNPWQVHELVLGQSIAVDGCCLTLTNLENNVLSFELSPESLSKTHFSHSPDGYIANLERAMIIGSRIDGHLVSGHVDCLAELLTIHHEANSYVLTFSVPLLFADLIVPKGSIAIQGVSLTVNEIVDDVDRCKFSVCIIPHTWTHTNLKCLTIGQQVNVEFDQVAKYILRANKLRQKKGAPL